MSIVQALIITLVFWVINWAEAWYAYPMINTPLVLCPIVGLILGDPTAGIIAGASLQLIFLGVMQIGGTLPADASLGSIIGVALAITTGQSVETALVLAVPVSLLGSAFVLLKYIINGLINPYVEKLCQRGDRKGLERVHVLISFLPDAPRMITLFVALAFGTALTQSVVDAIPEVVQGGLDCASDLMPAVGIALLLKMMWSARMALYFFLGVILVSYFNVPLIAVACVGVVLAFVVTVENKGTGAGVSTVEAGKGAEEELFND